LLNISLSSFFNLLYKTRKKRKNPKSFLKNEKWTKINVQKSFLPNNVRKKVFCDHKFFYGVAIFKLFENLLR
jgi:hypothetical protein